MFGGRLARKGERGKRMKKEGHKVRWGNGRKIRAEKYARGIKQEFCK